MDSKSLPFITRQSLFFAVRSGDLNSVKSLFQCEGTTDPASVSALMALQNDAGETVLYIASENNFLDVFSFLLKFCDLQTVKIRSKSDMDAFHVAANRGHLEIVKELLAKWPDLSRSCDSSKTSPLYSAAEHDHLVVVNAILDTDPTAAQIVRKNGKTALHNAARYGRIRIVKALISRDPSIVAIKDKKGQTALHMAVKGQDISVVEEILLANSSILNERDKKGCTALHMATRKSRSQIVSLLLCYTSIEVNAVNKEKKTAMDLLDKLQYGEHKSIITEVLTEAGGKNARHLGETNDAIELKRTVSDIKHEVHSQFIQNEKTNKRVSGIAKELKKIHREAVQNTINSVTVVAVLFSSIAFLAIFNLPGQYQTTGEANISHTLAFRVFCLLNATSLFISLAVVVVQITLVAWDTTAQRQIVSVINKLMWAACMSTCGAFLSIAFVVVGKQSSWMGITVTVMGVPILVATIASLCYFVFRQHFGGFRSDSHRRIRRASGSKSFSWSHSVNISDLEENSSDREKTIYAL
ncbi:ankyrin repeat-containing protein At2g01680 [Impatiens glandulifera]|uniref:ankyrin repeat-containing protein At2g01680 n=1 Tax=Impatiens glandulifera TaxID=253017 RepID=UPI001FB0EAE3|nr:ankyrin repeat-containing protein At2g01680 [Impatiens glandulifera]